MTAAPSRHRHSRRPPRTQPGSPNAPDATLLMLAFGPTRMRSLLEGVSQQDVERAFPMWELVSVDPAQTKGLGWPMNRTHPQWYRLRRTPSV